MSNKTNWKRVWRRRPDAKKQNRKTGTSIWWENQQRSYWIDRRDKSKNFYKYQTREKSNSTDEYHQIKMHEEMRREIERLAYHYGLSKQDAEKIMHGDYKIRFATEWILHTKKPSKTDWDIFRQKINKRMKWLTTNW